MRHFHPNDDVDESGKRRKKANKSELGWTGTERNASLELEPGRAGREAVEGLTTSQTVGRTVQNQHPCPGSISLDRDMDMHHVMHRVALHRLQSHVEENHGEFRETIESLLPFH